jgi:hypothetical protein
MLARREARSFGIALLFILSSCKKTEPVQQVAPTETGPIVVASSSASASVEPSASAMASAAPSASASASASTAPTSTEANVGLIGHQGGYAPEHFMTGRPVHVPLVRQGTINVAGKLPMEVVRRIVRQRFGMFRACYEDGLKRNPILKGGITVKFVIGRDGDVIMAQDGGSDLPDANVVGCVVSAFKSALYPKPEEGIVVVSFPLTFSPSDE